MGFEAPEEEKFVEENDGENFEEVPQEIRGEIVTAPEETLESPHEETNASGDEKAEEKGFMQGLVKGKKAVLAATAAGMIIAGAGEASGGIRERVNDMFDELDGKTEVIQKAPSERREAPAAQKSEHKDLFSVMEQIGELGNAYKEAETDAERDRIAGEIAQELILGGKNPQLQENTAYIFTSTLLGTPVEVSYIILDGVARGSLKDNSGTFLQKTHTFQFMVK